MFILPLLGKIDMKIMRQRDQYITCYDIPWLQEAQDVDIIMKGESRDRKQHLKGGGRESFVGVRRWSWTNASHHRLGPVAVVVTDTSWIVYDWTKVMFSFFFLSLIVVTHMHSSICKYNLLNSYNVICKYMFGGRKGKKKWCNCIMISENETFFKINT